MSKNQAQDLKLAAFGNLDSELLKDAWLVN